MKYINKIGFVLPNSFRGFKYCICNYMRLARLANRFIYNFWLKKRQEMAMPSDRQIEANRRNAQKSTGPRTVAGKARVSKNAMKHGLAAAHHLVLADEDPAEFVAFEDAIFDDLDPQTALEGACVRRLWDFTGG